jgi:ribokinase
VGATEPSTQPSTHRTLEQLPAESRAGTYADFDVVVVGSANLDLVVRSPRIPRPGETLIGGSYDEYPGGKGLNQAVAAARSGARVAFVGAFGDDDAGTRLRAVAGESGVDTTATPSISGPPTGRALITVSDDGENTIVVVPGSNARVDSAAAPSGSIVLAQLEIPVETVTRAFADAKRRGARTILNPAPATELPQDLLAVTDVIVPNEHEIQLVGGVGALLAAGVSTVIVTMGASGVEVTTTVDGSGSSTTRHGAIRVDVVDTTGAGDAFCGALAARLAAGDALADAVGWAIRAGGLATTRHGAVPSLPTREEIIAFTPP